MKAFAGLFTIVFSLLATYFFVLADDGVTGWVCGIGAGLCLFLIHMIERQERDRWLIQRWKY